MSYSIEDYIKNEISIEIKKRKGIFLNKDAISEVLKRENYHVEHINFQNNSINGITNKNKDKFFFKILNKQEFTNEINGYLKIKDKLPVNKIKDIFEFENYYTIIFEYEETIEKNKGLLNDFFVRNDFTIEHNADETINKVITLYEKIFEDTTIKEEYPMQQFFDNRIDSRLKKWYNNEELFDYEVMINGRECKRTKEIIEECINFFNVKHELRCSLTQGDPNTLNIGTKPVFFDFATSGYNPIICEFSVIFWSVLIADAYFCPKYHQKSYYNHEEVLKNIKEFTPNLKYEINDIKKKIKIESDIKTSRIRIKFIQEYIKMLEKLHIKIGKEMIYFLAMRILCIFDIKTMEVKDYYYSIFLLHYMYKNIQNDTYSSLNDMLNNI